jgi:hypothetical protein
MMRVSRQITLADDAADCALTADQNSFDVAPIFIGDEIGYKRRSAGEVDDIDIIAGIVEQCAGCGFVGRKIWRDQRIVGHAQTAQQIVIGPFAALAQFGARPVH